MKRAHVDDDRLALFDDPVARGMVRFRGVRARCDDGVEGLAFASGVAQLFPDDVSDLLFGHADPHPALGGDERLVGHLQRSLEEGDLIVILDGAQRIHGIADGAELHALAIERLHQVVVDLDGRRRVLEPDGTETLLDDDVCHRVRPTTLLGENLHALVRLCLRPRQVRFRLEEVDAVRRNQHFPAQLVGGVVLTGEAGDVTAVRAVRDKDAVDAQRAEERLRAGDAFMGHQLRAPFSSCSNRARNHSSARR